MLNLKNIIHEKFSGHDHGVFNGDQLLAEEYFDLVYDFLWSYRGKGAKELIAWLDAHNDIHQNIIDAFTEEYGNGIECYRGMHFNESDEYGYNEVWKKYEVGDKVRMETKDSGMLLQHWSTDIKVGKRFASMGEFGMLFQKNIRASRVVYISDFMDQDDKMEFKKKHLSTLHSGTLSQESEVVVLGALDDCKVIEKMG